MFYSEHNQRFADTNDQCKHGKAIDLFVAFFQFKQFTYYTSESVSEPYLHSLLLVVMDGKIVCLLRLCMTKITDKLTYG